MKIQDLSGKKICILGFGKEGQAMLQALKDYRIDAEVTIADRKPQSGIKGQFGDEYLKDLARFDVVIKSPGIPPCHELDAVRMKITSSTQIFLDTIKDTGATVIGVTGSKGKSTTSTLIFEILKAAGKKTLLIGNIGEAAIAHLKDAKSNTTCGERSRTIFVQEMSSYQLMDVTVSPHIAVITSFFPEHLDYHGTLDAYKEAKTHIARFQVKDDLIFFNALFEEAKEIAGMSKGKKIRFSADDCPVTPDEIHLIGEHNRSNMAAATLVARKLGVSEDVIVKVLKAFRGLPHRLQSLGVHHGIEWIDDAISTTPESTIAALDALGDSVTTVILGGQDRGNDFTALAQRIRNSSVKTVILFPGSGPRIRSSLEEARASAECFDATSMQDAVMIAQDKTHVPSPESRVPICLLSTASPSYNMFRNFEEKGDTFARCIRGNVL